MSFHNPSSPSACLSEKLLKTWLKCMEQMGMDTCSDLLYLQVPSATVVLHDCACKKHN